MEGARPKAAPVAWSRTEMHKMRSHNFMRLFAGSLMRHAQPAAAALSPSGSVLSSTAALSHGPCAGCCRRMELQSFASELILRANAHNTLSEHTDITVY